MPRRRKGKHSAKSKDNTSEMYVLNSEEKQAIGKKYNAGYSTTEIAKHLEIAESIIKEHVESTFITFNGEEGEMVLETIYKIFGAYPIAKLREMIAAKNFELQNKICCELPNIDAEKFEALKKYFLKFEQSQIFFGIDEILSIEEKTYIRSSGLDDIQVLSFKLNRMEKVIRDYLLRYSPDGEFLLINEQKRLKQLQKFAADFAMDTEISYTTYRMIISHSFSSLIENAKTCGKKGNSLKMIFNELLALAFYYIKCSLPLEDVTEIFTKIAKISLSTLDLFHLIFQMSDPVVRGLCIEHYSFSNPVPFYYPILGLYPPELTSSQFEICKELWYSLQQFSGLVSFGLGWASWNPVGKSHLLDLMFDTDFVKGSPQNSPFHLNSIDIQMTKNLFGKKESTGESTQWAYIDCHGCSDMNVIKDICQNLDIALIHVSYSDYRENYSRLMEDLNSITVNTKHVYVLVRDCTENDLDREKVIISDKTITFIFIPNLIKIALGFKEIGYMILHSPIVNPRLVGSNFLENVITRNDSWANLEIEKNLIESIMNFNYANIQDTGSIDFSELSYYPHFVEYMSCFYKASSQEDQNIIDELNRKCEQLANHLENAEMNVIVWHFNEILAKENSTLILWKLSQEFNILSKRLSHAINGTPFSLEILWREALLSNKYNSKTDKGTPASKYFETFSSNFSKHVERGEPFELIDGDNLRFFNQDINVLLSKFYEKQNTDSHNTARMNREAPIVVSIFGPQSSGKSTLLNYCFGCKFLTSAGRCTKGIYASLSKLSQPTNNSDHFLILDTEGLDASEKVKSQNTSGIHFDRTMVLFCLAVSQVTIINIKGDFGKEMQNLLQICAYSLDKLKVSKVAAPKIFFVLNQQADPDPDKHLNSINTLLEKLNEESYLMDTEGLKISDLIQVSKENLFVLPSAFNSKSLNTQITKLFDSDLCKLSPTISFANRCADLRMSIIHQLERDVSDSSQTSFNTMSEWMEMSGVIWDTIVKYQDIVKYRNTDELKCSNALDKILRDILLNKIHLNKEKYQQITKKTISTIKKITKSSPPREVLDDVERDLSDVFNGDEEKSLTEFGIQCQADALLRRMDYMCDGVKSNLRRLIYMEKKIYRDKLNLAIKARLTDLWLKECKLKLQQTIEKNCDKYLELSIEKQKGEFEKLWIDCFSNGTKEEETECDKNFDELYSLFRMESKTMENKQTIYAVFCDSNFNMDTIIQDLGKRMVLRFCDKGDQFSRTDHFIYPWKENRVPIKEMTPYIGKVRCEYLSVNSLYHISVNQHQHQHVVQVAKPTSNIKFRDWVPSDCYPLINYCSGFYNHPDIIWKIEKRKQILLLASQLKDPNNYNISTWDKFITDIAKRVQDFTNKDPNISHSTVKEIVDFLYYICKLINYEMNFIEAKLSDAAERTISTYAFAFAFKSLLKTNLDLQNENKSKQMINKKLDLKYFLQKVENQKLARGNWDRKTMREGDKTIANKFAEDLLAAVWRDVNADCEQDIKEKYFHDKRNRLSHKSILLLANEKITEELEAENEPIHEENIVIQYTCNRVQNLKELFKAEWLKLANELHDKIVGDMRDKFTEQILTVKHVLSEFLDRLVARSKEMNRLEDIGSDSDSNFEIADKEMTGQTACNSDPKAKYPPLKAMVFFLEQYLNPKLSSEEFKNLFDNVFEMNGMKMKTHHQNYVLFQKPHDPTHRLSEEMFTRLTESNMFENTETIFNIKVYVQEYLRMLNCYKFQVTEAEFKQILKDTKEKFEADVINCPRQCPSCGKFCEREIHPNGGKCQIMTGHQICSMGGNVWNTDEDRTAILLMCEDYNDHSPVLTPGQNMKWWEFKEKCGDQWDWSLPTDEEYLALQKENRDRTKQIWKKFGRIILKYYANRGTPITYIPYTSPREIYASLFESIHYICYVIDGTVEEQDTFESFKYSVSLLSRVYTDFGNCYVRVIIYHGHSADGQKCIEYFPDNNGFTSDSESIQNFLKEVKTYGNQGNELAILDGLATATTETDLKSGLGICNWISHHYVEPTNGFFNIFKAEGKCIQGCPFDWETDVREKFNKFHISYRNYREIKRTHPDYDPNPQPQYESSESSINSSNSVEEVKPKTNVFINYKTDK